MSEELVKVTINGQDFDVAKGARLIDVIREKGYGVPSFCYYSDLALQASCRMCLVRIEKMPKLQTSCTITCTDGMIVTTQSEEIEKAQRAMSEFLLANHPLDCPVCDRGGECELQEMVFDWGGLEERFVEKKNAHPEKYLSPMVANDPQRCILCKRCTRVCDEWMGEEAIEAGNRGVNTVIGTYGGWLNCSECGNCIEVCPTGTLLDGTYRHTTRPWELDQTISTCTYCSDGCQLSVGSRGGEVLRVVARDRYVNGLNGEFLCIKGRFAHNFVNSSERIKTPLIRYKKGGKLIPATWDEAIRFVAENLDKVYNASGANAIGVIGSSRLTNESLFALRRFAGSLLETVNYALTDAFDIQPIFDNLSAPLATHADIRKAKTIVVVGGEPEEYQPLTAKQIRQAVRNGGAKLIVISERPTQLSTIASRFIHIAQGSLDAFVLGMTSSGDTNSILEKTGAKADDFDYLRQAFEQNSGNSVLMFGNGVSSGAQAALAGFAGTLATDGGRFLIHPLVGYNNSVGAHDMMSGRQPLAAVLENSRALYIAGSIHHNEFNQAALANKDFIVVQELFETETTAFADVILPAASFAEADGTFTNNDGFVQRVRQAVDFVHQSRPDWMITSLLARELGTDFGWNMSASAVFREIADTIPAYNGLRYPMLRDESSPVQVKHEISALGTAAATDNLRQSVQAQQTSAQINNEPIPLWHELHRVTTMTGKTEQFHLLANGNPKPKNLLVAPLYQFNLDGTERKEAEASASA